MRKAAEAARQPMRRSRRRARCSEVCAHLRRRALLRFPHLDGGERGRRGCPDLAEVRGQRQAKRAPEIAAAATTAVAASAGRGSRCSRSGCPRLPPLDEDEALEVAAIVTAGGTFRPLEAGACARTARRTTRRAGRSRSSAAAAIRGPARFRSRTGRAVPRRIARVGAPRARESCASRGIGRRADPRAAWQSAFRRSSSSSPR